MKEELIALNYECSKCNERMGLYERKSAVLDGDFEWVCSTITSQNIYGRTPMILLTMRPSRLFVKIRCHAVASTEKDQQNLAKEDEETQQANINDENTQDYDDQQPSEKDIVQPEDTSNAPTEKCLENVGYE
ncbi:hypothetical protein TNCV_392781 [Trichonephila clavipes]|nr:hypothetical protein TNCV_392781 [Trichonephila clavipes]